MTIPIQQVSNTSTFYFWKSQTNLMADALSNVVLTTVANTVGNSTLQGTFTANSVVANSMSINGYSTIKGVYANGVTGTPGQVLASNGAGTYWASLVGSVTSINTGAGLTGGPITTTGTVSLELYDGSSPTNASYPIGTVLPVYAGNAIRIVNQQDFIYTDNLNGIEGNSGSLIGGIWKNRGLCGIDFRGVNDVRRYYLYQRVS